MHTLAQKERHRILPLVPDFGAAGHMAYVHSLIEGTMNGHVYVDDPDDPQTALAAHESGYAIPLGTASYAVVEGALPEIQDRLEKAGNYFSRFIAVDDEWSGVLGEHMVSRGQRAEFTYSKQNSSWANPTLPEGADLVEINEELAGRIIGRHDDWLFHCWGGVEGFLQGSFGAAVIEKDAVASFCAATAIGGGEANLLVSTAEEFGRQNLATIACHKFLQMCRERSLHPDWNCDAAHEPSKRLARKLGFTHLRDVDVYKPAE